MSQKKQVEKGECDCIDTTPIATFIDANTDEAFLLQVCENCGNHYLLVGQYPLEIC